MLLLSSAPKTKGCVSEHGRFIPLADIARARVGRGGINVHCFKSGRVRENDEIVILEISFFRALAMRWRSLIDATR
jgi:hypothetical protein